MLNNILYERINSFRHITWNIFQWSDNKTDLHTSGFARCFFPDKDPGSSPSASNISLSSTSWHIQRKVSIKLQKSGHQLQKHKKMNVFIVSCIQQKNWQHTAGLYCFRDEGLFFSLNISVEFLMSTSPPNPLEVKSIVRDFISSIGWLSDATATVGPTFSLMPSLMLAPEASMFWKSDTEMPCSYKKKKIKFSQYNFSY